VISVERAGVESVATRRAEAAQVDSGQDRPPLRTPRWGVAVACGDAEAERRVLDAVGTTDSEFGALQVTRRCLSASELIEALTSASIDVAVVGTDLHGLGSDALGAVTRANVPLVILAGRGLGEPTWDTSDNVAILPAEATSDQVADALRGIRAGGFRPSKNGSRSAAYSGTGRHARPLGAREARGEIIAITGTFRGVGCSTLAANLAAELGRRDKTVLYEADLLAPSLAAALGLDPARNVYLLAHEQPGEDDARWDGALAGELQPIDVASPHGSVLSGVPRPSLRSAISTAFVSVLLEKLSARADFVVVDVPACLEDGSPTAALHAIVLERAGRIFVVTTPDVVGLRRTAVFVNGIATGAGGADTRARMSLVLNRHRKANHADAEEIAAVLRMPVAATVPDDPARVQHALDLQRPVVGFGARRGSAAHAIEDLATRIQQARQGTRPPVARHARWWHWMTGSGGRRVG
jgi:Flp pilus assembly CpaE family ATPase